MPYHEKPLTFTRLRHANIDRWLALHGSLKTGREHIPRVCCEMALALGRAAESFARAGDPGASPDNLADTLADLVICADLIAGLSQIRLSENIVRRFDQVSASQNAGVYIDPNRAPDPNRARKEAANPSLRRKPGDKVPQP